RQEVPSRAKVLGDGSIRRQKALGMSCGLEPLHAIFALACRAMRVLTPVVEVTTLPVFDPRQDLALGRAVALELIRNDDPRHVLEALEQLAEKLLRRLLIAPALHRDIEHMIVLIDGAPQVIALPVDRQKDLVKMPFVSWLGASVLQLIGIILPKLQTPLPDGF